MGQPGTSRIQRSSTPSVTPGVLCHGVTDGAGTRHLTGSIGTTAAPMLPDLRLAREAATAARDRPRRIPRPPPPAAGARRGCGKIGCLLARRPRHGHVLPAVQESADLVLAVATVATRGADRRQLAAPRPPGDGLRVDPKHRGNLGRGQKTILRLDLGSHDGWSSRAWG